MMLGTVRAMIRKMGFVGGLLLTLAFAMPAFESHACAAEVSLVVAEAGVSAPAGRTMPCSDCGPACANGCCHAPHAATPPDISGTAQARVCASPAEPSHVVGRALDSPGGPERPPRV